MLRHSMVISLLLLACLALCASTREAIADDFIVDGFRGIRWGDGPSALGKDRILVGESESEITYMRNNDAMSFYGIRTEQPLYVFSKRGLTYAYARFTGIEKYGQFLRLFNDNGIHLDDMSADFFGEHIAGTNISYTKMHIVETRITGITLEFFSDNTGTVTVYQNNP